MIERSLYLKVAKLIRDRTSPNDRILVSAFYEVYYILADRLPPRPLAYDLTLMDTAEYVRRHPELIEVLRQEPPRIVVESMNYPVRLHDYWPDFDDRYHLVETFARNPDIHMGGNAIRVWELNQP